MIAAQALAGSAVMAIAVALTTTSAPVKTLTGMSSCDASTSSQRGLIANAEVEPSLATDAKGRNPSSSSRRTGAHAEAREGSR